MKQEIEFSFKSTNQNPRAFDEVFPSLIRTALKEIEKSHFVISEGAQNRPVD